MTTKPTKTTTVTRRELHELVWTTPLKAVGERFGVTGTSIAKVCDQHRVPRPMVGHWQNVEHGWLPPRQPLPSEGADDLVDLAPPVPASKRRAVQAIVAQPPSEQPTPVASPLPAAAALPTSAPEPPVPTDPHPLVEKTRVSFEAAKPNDAGYVVPRTKQALDVCVAPGSVERALSILNTLLRKIERAGYTVSLPPEGRGLWVEVVDGERFSIGLSEGRARRKHKPTKAELEAKGLYWRSLPEWDYYPSGQLVLSILNLGAPNARRTWSDASNGKVEEKLDAFVRGLPKAVVARRAEAERSRQRAAEYEVERRNAAEREAKRQLEQQRVRHLDAQLTLWNRARMIRDYLADAEKAAASVGRIDPGSEMATWLTWVRGYLQRVDPLSPDYNPDAARVSQWPPSSW